MPIAHIDAFSGIAGDMTVGALLDCGLEIEALRDLLAPLALEGVTIRRESVRRGALTATKFHVDLDQPPHSHRSWASIRSLLSASALPPPIRERALAIFARLAEAEGKIHGRPADEVTFHEVGALDSIVDIVGAAWGLESLGIDSIYVGQIPLGSGTVETQHGTLPIPAPATLDLLRGFDVLPGVGHGELVTPTGAAILATCAQPGPAPMASRPVHIGYGAGNRDDPKRPNVVRITVADTATRSSTTERLVMLEANVDDQNPEHWSHAIDRLLAAGALDAFLTPIQMKKGRPATLVSVLCAAERREACEGILFAETTTLGVRIREVDRVALPREVREVETPYGRVQVKVATAPDGTTNVAPEHDDCRRLAEKTGVALKVIHREALVAALKSSV